jgi:hypothetical protein
VSVQPPTGYGLDIDDVYELTYIERERIEIPLTNSSKRS